ncbi:YHR033W-like protein [Saccharomyces cerevisiae AWRI796]|nr:YHR033W-like protein [Saccharomyces cerevisiae AWRI796]EGA82607.1 YHR033W-like protein [Saccharomyces cerevisiae Lalvin QA23]EGA86625.1 YHR033W-like protein [Saccharomyces cerevisiae VL3]
MASSSLIVLRALLYWFQRSISLRVSRICAVCSPYWENSMFQRAMRRPCPTAAIACTSDNCLGLCGRWRASKPTAMPPLDTMITLWPMRLRFVTVSTINVMMDNFGSFVLSSTSDELPSLITIV